MSPWTDPNSYEPEECAFCDWWERNRVRAVVFAVILILVLCAVFVPDRTRPAPVNILIDGPEQ
jgi:hypothetical protein